MSTIPGINTVNLAQALQPTAPQTQQVDGEGSFKDFLLESIREVNDMQQQADRSVEDLFTGGDVTAAEVLTAVQKADLAFKTMMQVRNKLVQVYQEVRDIRI